MNASSIVRIFGGINLFFVPLFAALSLAAGRSLSGEFLSAKVPFALMSFCLFAFTVWLAAASILMLFGRRFSVSALLWNGIVLLFGFGALCIIGLSEKTGHDSLFFAVVGVMLFFVLFGAVHLFCATRPALRERIRDDGGLLRAVLHPAVLPLALILSVSGPAAVFYLHTHGIKRPCFVSRISASAEERDHAASLVFDASPETYWSPSFTSDGVGSTLRIEFPFNHDVVGVAVGSGASDRTREFLANSRIRSGVISFSTGDEFPFELDDEPQLQRIKTDAKNARWMTLKVTSVYRGQPQQGLCVGAVIPLRQAPIFR